MQRPVVSRGALFLWIASSRSIPFAALVVAVAVVLAACATQPATPAAFQAREVASTFSVSGRIAARTTDTGSGGDARRGFSGGFTWAHKPGEDAIELLTPLGQIAARLTMTPSVTHIELADGQRATTDDPEQYLGRALGISLPIAALPYWMQAAPVPSTPMRAEPDPIGRLEALWQNGWQIRYSQYSDAAANAYPTRIELSQGDVEARIIISEWKSP